MQTNAYDILNERGFISQCTHEDELRQLMGKEKLTFYMGYDPTADSLTAGHLLTLMAHAHLQKAGHRLITLMGTGTGMIGDPSDRNDMRRVMTREIVAHHIACFKKQFARFVEYGDGKAIMEENGWLLDLKLVEFMRDYGVHFSVNKMLAAECYKSRLEGGLTAFEFTYMLMQAYDFLELYRRYGCRLQLGGSDQWSNIIAGVELIRKTEGAQAYGLTFNLLTAGDGSKMGKSAGNAIWLDAEKTSPYDFYQYWRNVEDSIVIKTLKLLTFLPMDEINEMAKWQGAELNRAKEILAFEITKIVHGEEEAQKSQSSAKALFAGGGDLENMPTTEIPRAEIPPTAIDLLDKLKLIPSRGEGRRLITQGGVKINDAKITAHDHPITQADFKDGFILVQKGKKIYHRGKLV
ncbi:MAG: tyrosine--tRNA ligase [Defluviitaleaceae bacterium]|nr:tyrosine--tRNA ligase [Defluviitaleaceae bacterium]MCL2263139.1 tyrosine--tRNA ligase [Defluviitaleaceae bacterium]